MDMKWHAVRLACQKCKGDVAIVEVSFAADGSILLDLICVKCGIELGWKSNFAECVRKAYQTDVDQYTIEHPRPPLVPPLALPEAPIKEPRWNDYDKIFLESEGIDPKEE